MPPAIFRHRRWPIATRLAVSYATSAFLLVAAATWLQYRSLARDLAEEDDQLLLSATSAISRDLSLHSRTDTRGTDAGADSVIEYWHSGLSPDAPIIRVASADCRGQVSSRNDKAIPDALPCFPLVDSKALWHSWTSDSGVEWRILATPLGGNRQLNVLLNRSTDTELLRASRRQLAAVLALVLVVASALGLVIARRALAPITTLADRVRRIDARTLDRRLLLDGAPPEVRELTVSFDEMLERLQAAFDTLSLYSAELAHELRTPLHLLRQQIEVALSRTRSPAEYRDVLGSSLEELERLRRMSDDILFLARSEDPRANLHQEELIATEELRAVADFMDALSDDRGVTVTIDGPPALRLRGDRTLIRRALANLMANAIAHTPSGGTIVLAARNAATGVDLSVSDSGAGIDPSDLPHIFDRYYRGKRAAKSGTGLGLAIVRGIAELHGGVVSAKSGPRGGTTMVLTLPGGSAG